MWHSEFKLYLYPSTSINAEPPSRRKKLVSRLEKIQLLGEPISAKRYATGENFLSLLTFMGCSPNIELTPQVDQPYCYIELGAYEQPQFVSGKNTKHAPCPHCKKALTKILEDQRCPSCQQALLLEKLNWRKSAFIACDWICIGNIYELEAIPNDELLDTLQGETGVQWKPAYIRHSTHRKLI